jgi:hypothetical protein
MIKKFQTQIALNKKTTITGVFQEESFNRIVEEDLVKLKNYDIITLDKVKEAENSKKAVFSTV